MSYLKKFLAITLIFVMQFQSVHASVAIGGGWWLDKPVVNGATTTWEAVKNGARSTVAISPSSAQVAKSLLRGGLVGLALSAVTQALLDGVDYVMDSAKQEVRYKEKSAPLESYYVVQIGYGYKNFSTAQQACNAWLAYAVSEPFTVQWLKLPAPTIVPKGEQCVISGGAGNWAGNTATTFKYVSKPLEKTIPLTTLATQIINLAEQGNPEAKAYIASVVQDMLEHDEDYRKSLEAELDAKLKEATQTKTPDNCPSEIRNKNGDCWICSRESHFPITRATRDAKTATRGKSCQKITDRAVKANNASLFRTLINAREQENSCWLPPDANHIERLKEDRIALSYCEK
ncbi:hypothetical protein [Acinetobacter pollinis]|uniref:hypothetical protein n=1 Tax=Acinetobacter pollinis TaxID=2605270 RepID=UPI0018C31E4C|nr:hypothetical protein [Acinetobacter pollinis]MBF7694155.1 hypothetical protein [Acinetobacter pollinis]MBF7701733.1 hypothetical protein [Acinetobacter pollinis]